MDITSFILGLKKGSAGEVETQEKTVSITQNGTSEILPDAGYALSKVTVNTHVSSEEGINWLFAEGHFDVTEDGTQVVTHNLGVIPDIVGVMRTNAGPVTNTTNKTYVINGFILSEKLLGEVGLESTTYGSCFLFNPSAKGLLVGNASAGLEHSTSPTLLGICNATEQTMQLGSSNAALMADSTYRWFAYARM